MLTHGGSVSTLSDRHRTAMRKHADSWNNRDTLLRSSIGRVAEWRQQQRYVIVVLFVANFERDGDGGKEPIGKMHRNVEHQPVDPGRRRFAEIENAPIRVGHAA